MFGPKCQSCGMPLSKDEKGGGTNKDGTKSTEYCSNCYQNGQFTEPDLTMEQMVEKVKEKMHEMRIPRLLANMFTKNIHKLKRWSVDMAK